MSDWVNFIDMGGYAGFVWPAYLLTALILAALAVASFGASRRRALELKKLQELSPHRQRRRAAETMDEVANGV